MRDPFAELGRHPMLWVSLLEQAMQRSGRGYRRPSLRHTGRGQDRRPDKLVGSQIPIFTGRLNVRRSLRA